MEECNDTAHEYYQNAEAKASQHIWFIRVMQTLEANGTAASWYCPWHPRMPWHSDAVARVIDMSVDHNRVDLSAEFNIALRTHHNGPKILLHPES